MPAPTLSFLYFYTTLKRLEDGKEKGHYRLRSRRRQRYEDEPAWWRQHQSKQSREYLCCNPLFLLPVLSLWIRQSHSASAMPGYPLGCRILTLQWVRFPNLTYSHNFPAASKNKQWQYSEVTWKQTHLLCRAEWKNAVFQIHPRYLSGIHFLMRRLDEVEDIG